MIAAARGIDAVIAGDDGDLAAGDEHLGTLQALVAAGDINGAAGDGEGIIGMHAVIAGGDGEAAAGDSDIAIGVDGVIAAIELEGTAGNGDLRPGLEALGAGVIGDALTRAARGGHGGGATADGQSGLRLDAVLARGEFERGAGDDEIAQGGIAVIGGAQGIPAAGDGDVSILDGQTILAVDAVIDGGDGDGGLLDEEGILAGDTIIIVGIDRQAAAAGNNQIRLGVEAGVGLFLLRRRVAVAKGVVRAVGQGGGGAFRQVKCGGLGLIDIQGAAGGAGNGGILQHQGHFLFGGIYKDAALGHGAGDHISAARRDGHHAVCHFRAGACNGRRLPGKSDGGGTAYIGGLHIGGGIRGGGGIPAGHGGRRVFIGRAASGGSAAFAAGGKAPGQQCGAYDNG